MLEIFQVFIPVFTSPVQSILSMSKSEHLGETELQIWQEKQLPKVRLCPFSLCKQKCGPLQMPCQLSTPSYIPKAQLCFSPSSVLSFSKFLLQQVEMYFYDPKKNSVTHTQMFRENLIDVVGRFYRNLCFMALLPQIFTATLWPPHVDFPLNCFIKIIPSYQKGGGGEEAKQGEEEAKKIE